MILKRILSIGIAVLLLAVAVIPLTAIADETVLSLNKSYTVEYDSPIENAYPNKAYRQENKLTDGKTAGQASYNDPAFLVLYRGTSVSVTVDLESICAVSSVAVRTLQIKAAGVDCARYVRVAVSEDGVNFGTVGMLEDERSVTSSEQKVVTHKVSLDHTYLARYVRVTFSSDVNTYCDEISVCGFADTKGAVSASPDEPTADRGFASPSSLDGIDNIVLMYTIANYSETMLKYYLSYVESSGAVSDTMFDSMLFLPSGASGYDYTTAEGWDAYIDNLFGREENINLTALNSLVGSMREQLGMAEDDRYPVFISIPYVEIGKTAINGVVPDSYENRLAIIRSYIDRIISLFADNGLSNLELKGFYWHHETVPYTNSDYEDDLMIAFNAYVHSLGYKSIWIPYYCAPGFETAMELGFDCATLQSGYAFQRTDATLGEVLPEAVSDSAGQAQKYGLGMEFEMSIGTADMFKRIYQYLYTGYTTGCMEDGVMMLYQQSTDIYQCANSSAGTEERQVYDLMYRYIKKTFTSEIPVVPAETVVVLKAGTKTSGTLAVEDPDTLRSLLDVVDEESPEGLTYFIEDDGFYFINATKTEPGMYTVTFRISDGYNTSETATLKVLVLDADKQGVLYTTQRDMSLYKGLNIDSDSIVIPAGTTIALTSAEGEWSYATATVDGEEVSGFVMGLTVSEVPSQNASSGIDSTDATDDTTGGLSSAVIWVIVIVVVLAVGAVISLVLIKRKKK